MFLHNLLKNLKLFWSSHWKDIILAAISISLFLIPQLFWGNLYIVGGDDSRLYYIFPINFLKNFSFNIISDNTLGLMSGYAPVSFFIPMFLVLSIFKLISFTNAEFLFYGLNLSFGFVFMYLIIKELIQYDRREGFYISITASLFYVLSLYITKTVFSNQLISVYLVSVLPASFYFFTKGINKDKKYYSIASVIIFSFFSSTLVTIPWWLSFFLVAPPALIAISRSTVKIFIKHLSIVSVVFLFLNFYWLSHMIFPYIESLGKGGTIHYLTSKKFTGNNDSTIIALSLLNSPLNQFYSYIRTSWSDNYMFPLFYILNIGFILTVVLAGFLKEKMNFYYKKKFSFLVAGLLLSFIMFTPNMGKWSLSLFLFLNSHFPLFSMFRNMDDKFSIPLAFYYAITFALSLTIVFKSIKFPRIKALIILYFLLVICINSYSFIFPSYHDTQFSTRISGNFNDDYINLTNTVKKTPKDSKFLWLPLNMANYVYIEDAKNRNHFYFGPSPLRILADRSDITGIPALNLPYDTTQSEQMIDYLKNKKYTKIGDLLRDSGINYIIVNNQKLPQQGKDFLYGSDIYELQKGLLHSSVIGKKIKDFGNRYTLYEINPLYNKPRVFLTSSSSASLSYIKVDSNKYKLSLKDVNSDLQIQLLEPYQREWELYLVSKNKSIKIGNSVLGKRYENSWFISIKDILNRGSDYYTINKNNSINMKLVIFFYPQSLNLFAYCVSIITIVSLLLYIGISIYRDKYFRHI